MVAVCAASLACVAGASAAGAVHLQPVGQLSDTTSLVSSPGEPNKLYITLVDGEIFSVDGGAIEPVVDLSSLVEPKSVDGEQALNSMALAPDFSTTRRFYVDYVSRAKPGENIVVAELIDKGTPEEVFASRRTVLEIPHPETHHHYSGDLQFGPEGDLFISTGDSYPPPNYPDHSPAQELSSPLGKILRIDPTPEGVESYTVPTDNPFYSNPTAYKAIWSRGMRNPFRFSIDKATSNLIIGDVGEEKWEELDFGRGGGAAGPVGGAGANFGWPCREGPEAFSPKPEPACTSEELPFTEPMLSYEHHDSQAPFCTSVIAGYVVHDPTVAALDDRFLYGDYCSGQISSVTPAETATDSAPQTELTSSLETSEEARTGGGETGPAARYYKIQAFGEDGCGRVYVLAGAVYRVTGETAANCVGLQVAVRGSGSVNGAGISCPGNCDQAFLNAGAAAAGTLTAAPAAGWHFAGWEGDCSGSGTCLPQMNTDRAVTAVFEQDAAQNPPATENKPSEPTKPPATTTPPSNNVKVGGFKVNKAKGTGSLTVTPAGAGKLKLTGKGIVTVNRSTKGGKVTLSVKPTGKTKQTLLKQGHYTVKLTIAFTPTGGKVGKKTKKVTLRLS